ncbi:CRISPR-associated ring nuclease Csm6 [Haemophilus haemolyticus]|uniref:CRISPR-associated protein, NE0113 family n=1 Tax=Haemophilus haemolyticus TaxID=726 RepID=A0A2X4U2X9_HAEHA|nr:CRISPR-associated ring nuclease Csm6 [Haemophilus haemolyticus]SQH97115.1 CRISPR-associated protein, NE0113 family [Haemophilus haemolyticus]
MNTYNKRILLSVTGMSPAVVTETLYALVTEKGFIPTEIQVITTVQGKNKLLDVLLGIEGGRKKSKGALQEFIEDYGEKYGFSSIRFDESCVHIIEDASGQNLPDIRTPEENEQAANSIVQLVGKLCQDEESQLHVSIAGGRKTMGFFMGYALSLYGREQDSLSHVLVDAQYENLPSFYYPKPYSYLINNRDGKEIDTKDSKVMLAEIPWVRLGLGVPEDLKQQTISYSDSVKNAQLLLDKPQIKFFIRERKGLSEIINKKVSFGTLEIDIPPKGIALLLSILYARKHNFEISTNYRKESIYTFLTIYSALGKDNEEIEKRFTFYEKANLTEGDKFIKNNEAFDDVFSEAAYQYNKKIRSAFSIGKNAHCDYLISKSGIYDIPIESANFIIDDIKDFLKFNVE